MSSTIRRVALALCLLSGATCAIAQPREMAAFDANRAPPAQDGERAARIRADLARIKLPTGFRIELFALVPDARHMALAPSGGLLMVGTRRSSLWAVTLAGAHASQVRAFAPGLDFNVPNGVCFTRDGDLLVVEHNRVLRFAKPTAAASKVGVTEVVAQGKLIPPAEESRGHEARVCRIGPDGLLYTALGQPHNVPPRDKLALYDQWGIGGIVRMNAADGSQREVYARGVRNSVGIEFNAKDGTLWFTDNQTDGMGDLIPPGEINRATRAGQFFGYPWTNSRVRITQYGYDRDPLPANIVEPQVETDAHAADLGLAFYNAEAFPPKYRGGIFTAQHGSWNRSRPIGARVIFTAIKPDGTAGASEVFAEGWLDEASGDYRGRPVDVAVLPDGSLLVSDDRAGALYRITHGAR